MYIQVMYVFSISLTTHVRKYQLYMYLDLLVQGNLFYNLLGVQKTFFFCNLKPRLEKPKLHGGMHIHTSLGIHMSYRNLGNISMTYVYVIWS